MTTPTMLLVTESPLSLMAVPGAQDHTGVITYWSASGDHSLQLVQSAWMAAGLPPEIEKLAPQAPQPAECLTRAVHSVAGQRAHVVRRHPKGGLLVIPERVTEDGEDLDLTSGQRLRVTWDPKAGALVFDVPTHPLVHAIQSSFVHHRTHLTAGDFGDHLPVVVRALDAVGLRSRGGFYFVPRTSEGAWGRVLEALKASTHGQVKVYRIPVLAADEALEAVVDAVLLETEAAARTVCAEVELAKGSLGKRAAATKAKAMDSALTRVEAYEALLGVSLVAARNAVSMAQGAVVAAALGGLAE